MGYGSRQHILDLLDYSDFKEVMNLLLAGTHTHISQNDTYIPIGNSNPKEISLPKFLELIHSTYTPELKGWWVSNGKNPTWDLLSTCQINNSEGILLIEAKAHESELHYSTKYLLSSPGSIENHAKIESCISEASVCLKSIIPKANLSLSCPYQFANRIASAVKLADCGLNVVLMYLGFLNDEHFPDCFRDSDHWQRVMGAYMKGVIPLSLPEQFIAFPSGGSLQIVIRAI